MVGMGLTPRFGGVLCVCNPVATQEQWRNVNVFAPEAAQMEKEPPERWDKALST